MLQPTPRYCQRCPKLASSGYAHCPDCRDSHRRYSTRYYQRLKAKVFAAYGGYRCACCGDTFRDGLQIDHINNDGAAHRRQLKNGSMYRWLIKNDYPPDFQILCAVCNASKAISGQCRCREHGRKVDNPTLSPL